MRKSIAPVRLSGTLSIASAQPAQKIAWRMPLFRQFDFVFPTTPTLVVLGRDSALEAKAREILAPLDADKLAREVHVEWNARLFSAAGRADSRRNLISLNPRLRQHDQPRTARRIRP